MSEQQGLTNKCNKMAAMLGMCHAILNHSAIKHGDVELKQFLVRFSEFIEKEIYAK